MVKINEKKYENVILYLASKLGGEIRGKKKLAKLLYFADFDLFEKCERPITGDVYFAWPMGPVPENMEAVVSKMCNSGKLSVSEKESGGGYLPTEVYKALREADGSVFDPVELQILDRVASKYGELSGNQLGDLSHAEAPYIGTEPNKEIAYELSLYRGTDFAGND